jgi:hypothetical protein
MEYNAREAIRLWNELVKEKQLRMAVDALPYYTQAVELLTRGRGIQFAIDVSASRLNGGAKLPNRPVVAMFESREAITKLTGLLVEANTQNLEDRYFG